MRKKLMALLLAAGLGITGIAMTAHAAETEPDITENCTHDSLSRYKELVRIFSYDYMQHAYYYELGYKCDSPGCKYKAMVTYGYSYEDHDLEQTYYPDGRVKSACTVCDYYYYF